MHVLHGVVEEQRLAAVLRPVISDETRHLLRGDRLGATSHGLHKVRGYRLGA